MVRTIKQVEEERAEEEKILEQKSIYDEEGIEQLREEGQISDWEAGFMQGAAGEGKGAKCRRCGKIFTDDDTVLERDIDGDRHLFCSDNCVNEFLEKREKESKKIVKDYER